MLFDTSTTQAAEASLDSLWIKTQVISNNLANVDTPGFKASNVSFEQMLYNNVAAHVQNKEGKVVSTAAVGRTQNKEGKEVNSAQTMSGKGRYQSRVTTDLTTSVREDGNNVSLEREQNELWKTYAQYSYLLDRISGHYGTINTAISNMKG